MANTTRIDIFGREGDDELTIDETLGALPAARLFGEGGQDILTGSSGGDLLDGGNDSDRLIWNPGDDNDLNEGDAGTDTIEVNGGNGAETFTTTANGARVRFDRVTPAPIALDIGTAENLVLNANGGDDIFTATGSLAALISITVDGGAGADNLSGSNGVDLLIGGADNDFIADLAASGGAGDAAVDNVIINGTASPDAISLTTSAPNVTVTGLAASVRILQPEVANDRVTINGLGGTDIFVVGAGVTTLIGVTTNQ